MSKHVGILGCGWLGLPLALHLQAQGHLVKGSVRSKEKLSELQQQGIDAFQINLLPDKLYGDVQGFLKDLQVLIIDIPPGTRRDNSYDFASSINLLMAFVEVYEVPQVIFVSSTSVFEDQDSIPVYDEGSTPNATDYSGKQLIAAESRVSSIVSTTTIIRPGGLIGADRHPVHYLAGKNDVKNPEAPVNLVNRESLILLITRIIDQEDPPKTVHAISEKHRSRMEYYSTAAQQLQLEAPQFDTTGVSIGKKILSRHDLS